MKTAVLFFASIGAAYAALPPIPFDQYGSGIVLSPGSADGRQSTHSLSRKTIKPPVKVDPSNSLNMFPGDSASNPDYVDDEFWCTQTIEGRHWENATVFYVVSVNRVFNGECFEVIWENKWIKQTFGLDELFAAFEKFVAEFGTIEHHSITPLKLAYWMNIVLSVDSTRFLTHTNEITTYNSLRGLQAVGSFYREILEQKL